jgi:hypothetical protein
VSVVTGFGAASGAAPAGPACDAGFATVWAAPWSGAALGAAIPAGGLVAVVAGAALGAAVSGPGLVAVVADAALGAAVSGPGLAAVVAGAALAAAGSGAALGAAALASALAAVLARARDVAVFAWALAVLPGRAAGVVFARPLAVVPGWEVAAVVFDRSPGPDPAGRAPAAGNPEAAAAGPAASAAVGRAADSVASVLPWSRSAEAALAARGRSAARGWLSVPAGCLLAACLGAGPVPLPVEPSPGVPFSEVTAP